MQDCPQGFYCPSGTIVPVPCPIGTYNDEYLKKAETDCKSCSSGYYCPTRGQAFAVDECPLGYYCDSRATKPDWYTCPISKFCPSGTGVPLDCPDGTYLNTGLALDYTDCTPCTPGYYCEGQGKTFAQITDVNDASSTYALCSAGYYCTQGSSIATPISMTGIGDLCPTGHYCPTGTITPLKCPIGTFARQTGQVVCDGCLEGYFCPSDSMINPSTCSASMYCPSGSKLEYPCPPGTLSQRINLASASSCSPCPLGYFCELYATITAMPCPAGFLCITSKNERPMISFDPNNP
jgi:hypothetical protein